MPAGAEQVRTIVVVGATGAGKSETIKQLGGSHVETGKPPEISDGFESCAREWATYDIGELDNVKYHLIDTVGLLDTNRDDEKAVENIAKLLEQLKTVVGVIYVVAGRMNPPEMETCNFLFGKFFHDLEPRQLLVLRTNVAKWESYDMQREKDYLKKQNGVPKRFLDANFVAVDFHPANGPDVIKKMTGAIHRHIKSWTTSMPSRQAGTAAKFASSYTQMEELEKVSAALEEQKSELTRETEKLMKQREDNISKKDGQSSTQNNGSVGEQGSGSSGGTGQPNFKLPVAVAVVLACSAILVKINVLPDFSKML